MYALASAGNVGWRERAQKHKLVDQSRILMMHSKHGIVDVVDVVDDVVEVPTPRLSDRAVELGLIALVPRIKGHSLVPLLRAPRHVIVEALPRRHEEQPTGATPWSSSDRPKRHVELTMATLKNLRACRARARPIPGTKELQYGFKHRTIVGERVAWRGVCEHMPEWQELVAHEVGVAHHEASIVQRRVVICGCVP